MEKLVVRGGNNLYGYVRIPAAKNSLLPLLAAAAIVDGGSVFFNCPDLTDIRAAGRILEHIGIKFSLVNGEIAVNGAAVKRTQIPKNLMEIMRGSVLFIGALLAAAGEAAAYSPGGCRIGARPIDIHLDAFRALGAQVSENEGFIRVSAPNGLRGARINLRFSSVGATENAILAAVKARGVTEINNAAREPEVSDLIGYLNQCGAKIKGKGSSRLYIEGVNRLTGIDYRPISDRITAATYIAATAIAGGALLLNGARYEDMRSFINICRDLGVAVSAARDGIAVYRRPGWPLNGLTRPLITAPFPDFPTDCAPLAAAMLCYAYGKGEIRETVFENRFDYCRGFLQLGAELETGRGEAVFYRSPMLHGGEVSATDLRGGAALVCLALGIKDETVIGGLEYIDRGYEQIESGLSAIGANIRRILI